jgi:hypothetical protein
VKDPIAEYYASKRREVKEAYERLMEARKRGAPEEEIRRLQRKYEDAGDCGD